MYSFFSKAMFETRVLHQALISFVILIGSQGVFSNRGLTNRHLKVAVVPWGPFLVWRCPEDSEWSGGYFRDCPNEGERQYKGVLWELLMFIQRSRNCTFTFVTSLQNWYGNCYGSENCTGMIGQASREEVDFALGIYSACL